MADLVRLIARVPPELHAAVKAEAARSRRSLQACVIEALFGWLAVRGLAQSVPEETTDAER